MAPQKAFKWKTMDRKQKAQRKHEGRVKKKQGEKIGKFLKRGGYIKDGLAAPSPGGDGWWSLDGLETRAHGAATVTLPATFRAILGHPRASRVEGWRRYAGGLSGFRVSGIATP